MHGQNEPEVNLGWFVERIRRILRPIGGGGPLAILIVAILAGAAWWLATGFYTVVPGEKAALRMFGVYQQGSSNALMGGTEPGLHWWWPSPVGQRAIVKVDEIRRMELGFRGTSPVPVESLMITGDENIVDAQLLVQYNVEDIELFLFRVIDPTGLTIRDATESALRQVVGSRNIDDVLTTQKEQVQSETKLLLQKLLDSYDTGIRILEVKLQSVLPPQQVSDAFDDVVRAKEDKEKIINLADAYEEDIIPKARGEAQMLLQEAEAFKAQRVNLATGQASRFLSILEEYQKAPRVTRQRLYLEAMEEILPDITKYIIAEESGGNLLELLPLTPAGIPDTLNP
ncbi:MAG: FtsH protease activity modulator HflK [SAR202 cluster bacterium]|jgi:membrane protease subunit HflK|nr:FtsH protease activity modulator HflK [SAR202 cluster bacterium]